MTRPAWLKLVREPMEYPLAEVLDVVATDNPRVIAFKARSFTQEEIAHGIAFISVVMDVASRSLVALAAVNNERMNGR